MAALERQPLLGRPSGEDDGYESRHSAARRQMRTFLSSKTGHYTVIALVAADVAGIFASFLINQYLCEHECCRFDIQYQTLHDVVDALGICSLVFASLFLAELACRVWAFGLSQVQPNLHCRFADLDRYFRSWFHWLDTAVIIAGFALDVCLHGVIEEAGSTIVVLRLWRVIEIIEELSTGVEEQTDARAERIEALEAEVRELRKRLGDGNGAEG